MEANKLSNPTMTFVIPKVCVSIQQCHFLEFCQDASETFRYMILTSPRQRNINLYI